MLRLLDDNRDLLMPGVADRVGALELPELGPVQEGVRRTVDADIAFAALHEIHQVLLQDRIGEGREAGVEKADGVEARQGIPLEDIRVFAGDAV